MAYITLQVLLLFIFNSSYCLSQGTDVLLFASVREAVGEIQALALKVTEMENTMSSKFEDMENTMSSKLEEMENTMSSKFEGLESRMDIMQGQLTEPQGSSKVDGVLQICVDLLEMERELQSQTLNRTCNNMNQIANLQDSFSTELERIEHSISSKVSNLHELLTTDECASADSNDCGPHASCQDKMILYQCDCLTGFTGDGFNCEDVDECSSPGENSCHRYATCNNDIGGYTCTCNHGVLGDGFNCEGCPTGFTDVPGAGCLKLIQEFKKFDDAIAHCSTLSAQLVVPQNFQALVNYKASLPNTYYWIGMRNRRWLDGRDVTQEEWKSDQPDNDVSYCGDIRTGGVGDFSCGGSHSFICQLK